MAALLETYGVRLAREWNGGFFRTGTWVGRAPLKGYGWSVMISGIVFQASRGLRTGGKPFEREMEARHMRNGREQTYRVMKKRELQGLRMFDFMKTEVDRLGHLPPESFLRNMIADLGNGGNVNKLEEVLNYLKARGGKLEAEYFFFKMKALSIRSKEEEILPCYEQMIQMKVAPTEYFYSYLVSVLSKAGRMSEVTFVLKEMVVHGFVPGKYTYNCIIDNFIRKGDSESAQKWYDRMIAEDIPPTLVTYSNLIRMHANKGHEEQAFLLLEEMSRAGIQPNVVLFGGLINGLSRSGKIDEANKAFQEMLRCRIRPNAIVLNSLMKSSVIGARNPEIAVRVYEMFEKYNIRPTIVTFSILLHALSRMNSTYVDMADTILGEMKALGIKPDKVLYTHILWLYANANSVEMAEQYFMEMKENEKTPDVFCYQPLLDLHSRVGDADRAIELLNEMRQLGGYNRKCLEIVLKNLCERGDHKSVSKLLSSGSKLVADTLEQVRQAQEENTHL